MITTRLIRGFTFPLLRTRQTPASSHQNITSHFIPSPNTRGTLDILFGSLFTILICAWTLQNLNIPSPVPQATTWRQTLHQSLTRLLNQTKFLLLALICPELWIGKAFQDFMIARRSCREMNELADKDGVTWTMIHAYFANLGAFKFKVKGEPWLDGMLGSASSRSTISLVSLERVYETIREKNLPTMPDEKGSRIGKDIKMSEKGRVAVDGREARSFSIHSSITGPQSMEIDSIRDPQETPQTSVSSREVSTAHDASSENSRRTDTSRNTEERTVEELFDPYYIYPNADQIKAMREWGMIDRPPQISAGDIAGMGSISALTKAVTFLQISWFVFQIITRAVKHLPISQLEIATLAFVICAILMCLLFWPIPQGITASVEINRDRPIRGHTLHHFTSNLLSLGGYCGFDMHFWPGETFCPDMMYPPPNDVVKNDGPRITKQHGQQQYPYGTIGIALAGTLFGVVHCLAWSFPFPNLAETIIWRAASLYITLVFVSWPISFVLISMFAPQKMRDKVWRVLWCLTLIANVIYAVARAALLVLV